MRPSLLLIAVALAAALGACARSTSGPAAPERVATPPPAHSPLARVQTGMSVREVENLLGPPTDQNEYVTGKAFIPFYFGPDRTRVAYFYKGLGRVVFAGGGGFSRDWHVERVEYDPAEPGRAR
ncbi:MAG TPA: hypothetical protein VKW76_02525 [Candidatus Binatia bacterium]|nr:hypothetical protein [Candidatus Binatia bacterium]